MKQVIPQNYCTFYLDKYYFGIEVEQVGQGLRIAPGIIESLNNAVVAFPDGSKGQPANSAKPIDADTIHAVNLL